MNTAPISFACPGCDKSFTVPADKAGKTTKCPQCGEPIRIPNQSTAAKPASGKPAEAKQRPLAAKPSAERDDPEFIPARQPRSAKPVQREVVHVPVPVQVPVQQGEHVVRAEHTVRAKGTFGSAFGGTMGILIAVSVFFLVIAGIGIFVVCGGGLALFGGGVAAVNKAAENVRKENEAKERSAPRALAMSESQTINGVTVEVIGVRVGKVELEDFARKELSDSDHLVVSLRLSTKDQNKKITHTSWSSPSFFSSGCSLKDNVGNKYAQTNLVTKIIGADTFPSITATQSANDVVTFEVPVGGATELELTLQEDSLSKDEKFRFRIPKALWTQPQTKAPDPAKEKPLPEVKPQPKVNQSPAEQPGQRPDDKVTIQEKPPTQERQKAYFVSTDPAENVRIEDYEVSYNRAYLLKAKYNPSESRANQLSTLGTGEFIAVEFNFKNVSEKILTLKGFAINKKESCRANNIAYKPELIKGYNLDENETSAFLGDAKLQQIPLVRIVLTDDKTVSKYKDVTLKPGQSCIVKFVCNWKFSIRGDATIATKLDFCGSDGGMAIKLKHDQYSQTKLTQ